MLFHGFPQKPPDSCPPPNTMVITPLPLSRPEGRGIPGFPDAYFPVKRGIKLRINYYKINIKSVKNLTVSRRGEGGRIHVKISLFKKTNKIFKL
jgi:hypothetical protein